MMSALRDLFARHRLVDRRVFALDGCALRRSVAISASAGHRQLDRLELLEVRRGERDRCPCLRSSAQAPPGPVRPRPTVCSAVRRSAGASPGDAGATRSRAARPPASRAPGAGAGVGADAGVAAGTRSDVAACSISPTSAADGATAAARGDRRRASAGAGRANAARYRGRFAVGCRRAVRDSLDQRLERVTQSRPSRVMPAIRAPPLSVCNRRWSSTVAAGAGS